MKGKVIFLVLIISILSVCIYGIFYFNHQSGINNSVEENFDPASNTTPLRADVYSGTIENILTTGGTVLSDSPDVFLDSIVIKWDKVENLELKVSLGDELDRKQELYIYKNKTFYATSAFKLIDIIVDYQSKTTKLILLNYEKLYIETSIPVDKLGLLNYDSNVIINFDPDIYNQKPSINGKIHRIGYQVNDQSRVDIKVKTKQRLLPGTRVLLEIELPEKVFALYTLKEMVMKNGDEYYVNIEKKDGNFEKRIVKIGQLFTMFQGDSEIQYVEILEGVVEGEKLITEIVEVNS